MRGDSLWIVAIVAGVLVVLVATAMIGNRDKSGETVPAGEWADSVCGSVAVWRGEIESIVDDDPPAERDRLDWHRGAAVGDAAGPDGLRPRRGSSEPSGRRRR